MIGLTRLISNRIQYKLTDRSRKELGLLKHLQEVMDLFSCMYQASKKQKTRNKNNDSLQIKEDMSVLMRDLVQIVCNWSDYTDDTEKILQLMYCNLFREPYLRPGCLLIISTFIKVSTFNQEKKTLVVKTLTNKLTNHDDWSKMQLLA